MNFKDVNVDHSEGNVPVSWLSGIELPPAIYSSASFSILNEKRKTDMTVRFVNMTTPSEASHSGSWNPTLKKGGVSFLVS